MVFRTGIKNGQEVGNPTIVVLCPSGPCILCSTYKNVRKNQNDCVLIFQDFQDHVMSLPPEKTSYSFLYL